MRALLPVAALVVAACAFAARAMATAPAPLEWRGPPECQGASRLSSGVERTLGHDWGEAGVAARVSVARAGARWHLTLSMDLPEGTVVRELDAESCAVVTDAAAVVLALALDEREQARDAGADTQTSSPPPPEAAPPLPAPDAVSQEDFALAEPDAAPPRIFPVALLATAVSDTGTLPRTAFGVGGGLAFLAPPLRIEATLAWWPGVSSDLDAGSARGGSFRMILAELRGCALADAGILSLGGCAGAGLASMRARAFGVTTPLSAGATWPSFVADAVALARVTRPLQLRASAGLAVPFARPPFEVEGLGLVHRPSAVALQLGAGLEAHF